MLLLGIAVFMLASPSMGQAPEAFNYQGIALDAKGIPVASKKISLRVSILQETSQGAVVMQETHSPTTDKFGQFSVNIGEGASSIGKMSEVKWAGKKHFLKTEIDINGANGFILAGNTQLLSVPYAKYADLVSVKKVNDTIIIGNVKVVIPGVKMIVDGVQAVSVNNQVWMDRNLDVVTYQNGDTIPQFKNPGKDWAALTTGAWCHFYNDTVIGKNYGRLYNWLAVTDKRKLCPLGWRMPTKTDFEILVNSLGGMELAKISLSESGTSYWTQAFGTNSSGFSARGGSWRGTDGGFYYYVRDSGWWWTITKDDSIYPWVFSIDPSRAGIFKDPYFSINAGTSIRCIKE
jgi:uncharacterized protein (TIGR02145 family)